MCRVGGRRCPGEHDPAVKEARNARRRAKYAADKAAGKIVSKKKKKVAKTTNNSETANNSNNVSQSVKDRRNPTLDTKMNREEKLLNETANPEVPEITKSRNEKLGITVVENTEAQNLDKLYKETTVRGKINYNHLDNESYKDFGFSVPTEAEYFRQDMNTAAMSERDLENMTPEQEFALYSYSGSAYFWINNCSYRSSAIQNLKVRAGVPDPDSGEIIGKSVDEVYEEKTYMSAQSNSRELLKRTTEELDSVLSQGKKYQRIVYRGISDAEIINDDVHEWIKQNRSLGTEIIFNGYTSTTMKPRVTDGFISPQNPVIYQILTPEGAAIKSVSGHPMEEEVLLPRNQRYMVVGIHEDVPFGYQPASVIQLVAINSKGEILDGTNSDPVEPLVTDDMLKEDWHV